MRLPLQCIGYAPEVIVPIKRTVVEYAIGRGNGAGH
jgi:hypothetical protein